MNEQAQNVLLTEFFSTYFHEDFLLDADNPDAVIARYSNITNAEERRALSSAIQNFSAKVSSDEELEDKLFREYGCYYRPSGEGVSARKWLKKIVHDLADT